MSRDRSAPLLDDFHAAIAWVALLAGFTLGVAVCRTPRDRPSALTARSAPTVPPAANREVPPPARSADAAPADESLFRAHALEIVVGLAIGAVALALTIYLFTGPS